MTTTPGTVLTISEKILGNLSASKTNKNFTAIEFGDRQHIEKRKKCVREFYKQFVEHPTTQNMGKRATLRTLRNLSRDRQELLFEQFEVANHHQGPSVPTDYLWSCWWVVAFSFFTAPHTCFHQPLCTNTFFIHFFFIIRRIEFLYLIERRHYYFLLTNQIIFSLLSYISYSFLSICQNVVLGPKPVVKFMQT